jgi:hypothetical protein
MDAEGKKQEVRDGAGAKARSVKEEEDASQKARLFAYEADAKSIDGRRLEELLEERYGRSSVGGRRFMTWSRLCTPVRWVVHVPEDLDGGPLRVGELLFEPTGEEAEEVELKTMVEREEKPWGERHQ